ncbi:MAG: hypothetical protein ABIH76_02285 [Candidatus Bathyarchaeota archaeon]
MAKIFVSINNDAHFRRVKYDRIIAVDDENKIILDKVRGDICCYENRTIAHQELIKNVIDWLALNKVSACSEDIKFLSEKEVNEKAKEIKSHK